MGHRGATHSIAFAIGAGIVTYLGVEAAYGGTSTTAVVWIVFWFVSLVGAGDQVVSIEA